MVSYCPTAYWPLNTALYVVDFHGNDPRFAYYFLQCLDLARYNSGSAQPSLNRNYIHPLVVRVPPLPEQRAIAHILGTLDDKIELNRRQNETLEAIARALFRSWFVDFDPVRTKAEGREPVGMDAETAALFPARLVDSELGPVPEGWACRSIYDVASVDYGAPYASGQFNADGEGMPLIRIRDLPVHSTGVFTPERHPRQVVIEPGDVVVGMDGEFRAYHWLGPTAVLNQRVCCFRPRPGVPECFVKASIEAPLALFERAKVGTTVIHLGKSDIDTFRVLVPPEAVMSAFGRHTAPLLARIVSNAAQNRSLAALRDALLPKLLSGEVRVNGWS